MAAGPLAQVLRSLQATMAGHAPAELLVGLDLADDAAAYRLSDELAIVVTVDFFTPIVDDPYAYGAIAAANSLSDVYAMGARPLLALNVAAFPPKLPLEISAEILRGGAEKALEAGIVVAGGHTVRDEEPKYGLVVLGVIHPQRLTRKGGASPGDVLLLSKPLGSGVVTTGLMRDAASADEVAAATASMMALNQAAAEVAAELGASAVTDVTGFGLLGHAAEMAERGAHGLRLELSSFPWLPGALRLAAARTFPGGAHDNRDHFGSRVSFDPSIEEWQQILCFSPETSGGLLLALPPSRAAEARRAAAARGIELRRLGEVVPEEGIRVAS